MTEQKTSNQLEIDESQIKKFFEQVNHKDLNHKFQVFKKDNSATTQLNVSTAERLIKLCKKHNLKGLSCLSVNPRSKTKTKTQSVTAITNILIDVDVKKNRKQNGVSTLEDKQKAKETSEAIIKELEEKINLRPSIFIDSGNGFHIYIPVYISLKNILTGKNESENKQLWDKSKIKAKLARLEQLLHKFNTEICEIDCISKDIVRRVKIPGTWNVKPRIKRQDYRMAKILESKSQSLQKVWIESNNTVFQGLDPLKKENVEQPETKITVDETVDLHEILQNDLKAKDFFEGKWNKEKYKKRYDEKSGKWVKRKKWTRSEAELGLAVLLFSKGLPERNVRNALHRSGIGKWQGANQDYRDLTITRAKQFISTQSKEKKVLKTKRQGNLKVEFLNPSFAWKEIKCYDITDDFVLQPLYHPVRGEYETENKQGETETKKFENMHIILLYSNGNGKRDVIYKYKYSNSSFTIDGSKYKIDSEPFYLKSLPTNNIFSRFLAKEKIDGKKVWQDYKRYRQKYLDVGEDHRKIIAQTAWDLATFFFMCFNAFPYNDFFGLRGSGKNRATEISGILTFHSQTIATTRSISSIFRSIDAMGSTWIKNEAETLIGRNKDDDLLELCLEGYKKGSSIPLTGDVGKNKDRPPLYFDVYSPKAFSSDKDIYGAFGTRMIKYLQQKTDKEQGKIELDKEHGIQLRDDAYLLRLQDGCKIKQLVENTSIDKLLDGTDLKLVSRDREIFFPLLLITKEYASKVEYKLLVEFIKDYMKNQRQQRIDEPISVVLRALYSRAIDQYRINEDKNIWIDLYAIRKEIIFSDPEAWKIKSNDGVEDKVIIRSSETSKFFSTRRIGSILSELGFDQKRRKPGTGNYQRKATLSKIKQKANTLNIQLDDIEKEKSQTPTSGEGYF